MAFDKKVKKITHATKEELSKLQDQYEEMVGKVHEMSPVGLFLIAAAGIAVILYFSSSLMDLIGLIMLLYPLYIFIRRGAHKAGYFEGYYEMMTKMSSGEHHPEHHEQ